MSGCWGQRDFSHGQSATKVIQGKSALFNSFLLKVPENEDAEVAPVDGDLEAGGDKTACCVSSLCCSRGCIDSI